MPMPRSFRPKFESLEVRDVPALLFVSTAGSDANPGTLASPYKTLAKAIARAAPGDEIVLRAGVHAGGVAINTPDVTIRSHDGEWGVIAAPNTNAGVTNALWVRPGADNLTLQRLEISGGYYYALKVDSNWGANGANPVDGATGLRVEDCYLHDSGRDVVKLVPGADDATFLRSSIFNSGRRDNSNAEGIDNTNADRMVVRDCHIANIATTGVYPKGGATDCVIERNLIRNCGVGGVMVGFFTDAPWMDPVENPDYYESIRATVRNNIIVGTRMAGIGLYASLDARVYNNTLVDVAQTAQAGLLFDRAGHWLGGRTVWQTNVNPLVANNIVSVSAAGNRPAAEVRAGGLSAGQLTAGNNLFYRPGGVARFGTPGGVNTFAGWTAWTGETGSREADPRLSSQYHLAATSPAVDAGRDGLGAADDYDGNPRGGLPDIGADEFGAGVALRTPPVQTVVGTGAVGAVVPAVNTVPTISWFSTRTIPAGGTTGAVAFTVGDIQTPAANLVVTVASSNTTLVPVGRVVLGGSGASRTVTVTPAAGRSGSAVVTLTVTDGGGMSVARTFTVIVTPSGATAATFVGTDAATKGSWVGKYGTAGYSLAGGPASLPAGTPVTATGKAAAWQTSSADPRALALPAGGRRAAGWFGYGSHAVDVDQPAGVSRKVSVYLLDFDRRGRSQKVEVLDGVTGKVLDTRTVGSYGDGVYLSWQVTGPVTLRFTKTAGPDAAVSGVFLD